MLDWIDKLTWWQIPLFVFATIVLSRVAIAPYWMYQKHQQQRKAQLFESGPTTTLICKIEAALSDWTPDGREWELIRYLRGTADMIEARGMRIQWQDEFRSSTPRQSALGSPE